MSPETEDIFLNPGEYAFGDRRTRIRTLLLQGFSLQVTQWCKHIRFVHATVVIRFGQCQDAPAGAGDAFHFVQSLQWVMNP